jgi:hypothetical protein
MSVTGNVAVLKMFLLDVFFQKKENETLLAGSTLNLVPLFKGRCFYHIYLTRSCILALQWASSYL